MKVVPGVSVASCVKTRPFNGRSATCSDVITCPRVAFRRLHRYFRWQLSTSTASRKQTQGPARSLLPDAHQPAAGCLSALRGLEALELHANRVEGDGQQRDQVMSGVVRFRFAREAGAWHEVNALTVAPDTTAARFIGNSARKAPRRLDRKGADWPKQPVKRKRQRAAPSYSALKPLSAAPHRMTKSLFIPH